MTHNFNSVPAQSSRINTFVVGSLMSAMIAIAGFLTFATFNFA